MSAINEWNKDGPDYPDEKAMTAPATPSNAVLSVEFFSNGDMLAKYADGTEELFDANPAARWLQAELAAARADAENHGADLLLAELNKRGINTDNWDGDEGLWPTLARCIAGRIAEAESANAQLRAELAGAVQLLEAAKCPACDGSGAIPHQVGDYEWEAQQCQWCFESKAAISAARQEGT